MPNPARRLALAVGLLLLLAACAAPTGSLQITVTGLPPGENADITVTGPGSYGAAVTTTTTLSGLTAGTYSLTAGTVTTTAVTTEYDATITPGTISVIAGETANVSVAYDPAGGTLAVAVSGLPPGVDADVNVTGPSGFDQDLTTSSVLTDLTPGEYSATANPVTDGTNDYSATVTGSPAEVSSSTGAGIEVAYALDSGSLDLTISGLPPGTDANVLVEGANGFSQVVTADTTLTDLAPGLYSLTAMSTRTNDPIVSEEYDGSDPPTTVEVTSNATTNASTAYSKRGGSGRLWRPLQNDPLLDGYTSAQLAASGAPAPDVALSVTGGASEEAVAFDGAGNAWVSTISGTLNRYDTSNLEVSATLTPDITIGSDGSSLGTPVGLAFDADGNLWVANAGSSTVEMFTPAQLAVDGTPTPTVTITSDGASLASACGVAFDTADNLWVASIGGRVEKFTPAQLAASGATTPDVTITSDGASLASACGVAFDTSGNLWVAAFGSSQIEKFTPAQLAASGATTPDVTLTTDGTSLSIVAAVAFDNSGNLWVNSTGTEQIEKFTPAQLATSGTPTPDVTIGPASSTDVGGIAFSPPPTNLPIHTP